jgi:hypothetical protein
MTDWRDLGQVLDRLVAECEAQLSHEEHAVYRRMLTLGWCELDAMVALERYGLIAEHAEPE